MERFIKIPFQEILLLRQNSLSRHGMPRQRELAARGKTPKVSSPAEMDRIWEEAKKNEGIS
jgi:hypothetical protein